MKIIIFGASGDLAKRKLFPALSRINLKNTEIIAFARTKYNKNFSKVLKDFYTYHDESFCDKIQYIRCTSYEDLSPIASYLGKDTFIYLSLPPEVYHPILKALNNFEYNGVAVEKPFGENYNAFLEFDKFFIDKLYFIDHFLLKHLIVAWPTLVSRNTKLKNLLTNKHISNVDVLFKEEIGGEGRSYFDTHGLIKDIVQNHISEIIAIAAIISKDYTCDLQANDRINIFKQTTIIDEYTLFGQ